MKKIHVEGDAKLKQSSNKRYSMIIGRFQPFHDGHKWLVDQCLSEGKRVLICVRDCEPDEMNPFTSREVERDIRIKLWRSLNDDMVKIIIIPDIDSVNFGRGVGYDIIEWIPPQQINDISATELRKNIK